MFVASKGERQSAFVFIEKRSKRTLYEEKFIANFSIFANRVKTNKNKRKINNNNKTVYTPSTAHSVLPPSSASCSTQPLIFSVNRYVHFFSLLCVLCLYLSDIVKFFLLLYLSIYRIDKKKYHIFFVEFRVPICWCDDVETPLCQCMNWALKFHYIHPPWISPACSLHTWLNSQVKVSRCLYILIIRGNICLQRYHENPRLVKWIK